MGVAERAHLHLWSLSVLHLHLSFRSVLLLHLWSLSAYIRTCEIFSDVSLSQSHVAIEMMFSRPKRKALNPVVVGSSPTVANTAMIEALVL